VSVYLSRVALFFVLPLSLWFAFVLWDVIRFLVAGDPEASFLGCLVASVDWRAGTALILSIAAYAIGLIGHRAAPTRDSDIPEPDGCLSVIVQLFVAVTAMLIFIGAALVLYAVTDDMTWSRLVSIQSYLLASLLAAIAAFGTWRSVR
jgi:hypothetical protein